MSSQVSFYGSFSFFFWVWGRGWGWIFLILLWWITMSMLLMTLQLLSRMFNILYENNPGLAGDRRRTVTRPPQFLRECTKKTVCKFYWSLQNVCLIFVGLNFYNLSLTCSIVDNQFKTWYAAFFFFFLSMAIWIRKCLLQVFRGIKYLLQFCYFCLA